MKNNKWKGKKKQLSSPGRKEPVVRPKIMAPFRNTVYFINCKQCNSTSFSQLLKWLNQSANNKINLSAFIIIAREQIIPSTLAIDFYVENTLTLSLGKHR